VRHVPGHSPGSVALVCTEHDVAIVGDAIFNGSIGRTDFPGCSMEALERSIRTQLYTLSDSMALFPGHGPPTTVGNERANNPFVSG
jgi:glyoxylase-like metal-dependent hydrolase (beta-lactamase superfamily II)